MKTTTSSKLRTFSNYGLILLSSFGLSFCLTNHFIFNQELSISLLLISTVVLTRSMMPHLMAKFSK